VYQSSHRCKFYTAYIVLIYAYTIQTLVFAKLEIFDVVDSLTVWLGDEPTRKMGFLVDQSNLARLHATLMLADSGNLTSNLPGKCSPM